MADATGVPLSGTITIQGGTCILSAQSTGTYTGPTTGNIANGDSLTLSRNYFLTGTQITGSAAISDTTSACTEDASVTSGTFTP